MAYNAQTFKENVTQILTTSPTDLYTNETNKPVVVRYVSEISSHISMTGDASNRTAFVPANCVEVLNIDPDKSLNAVRGDSETSSPAWITVITQV